mmetsp:Transcript_42393/g.105544  ORF Transcript_42393/g.105544 Transcript_42393/m.105544 type:complete len:94 (+) Transcript_42393:1048-1329(+)
MYSEYISSAITSTFTFSIAIFGLMAGPCIEAFDFQTWLLFGATAMALGPFLTFVALHPKVMGRPLALDAQQEAERATASEQQNKDAKSGDLKG